VTVERFGVAVRRSETPRQIRSQPYPRSAFDGQQINAGRSALEEEIYAPRTNAVAE